MSAARKPVIVRKLSRDWCAGYASRIPSADEEEMELLDVSGKLMRIRWSEVKWVCYVRELAGEGSSAARLDPLYPERLLRRRFTAKPRVAGLWLRLILADGDELEGVAANDRSLIDGAGLLLTPPDTRSNTQRVYIPRSAIRELAVLGVIAPAVPARRQSGLQPGLFVVEPPDESLNEPLP